MALNQNDIIEVQVIGSMQGQPIFNVFHFERESLGATPADADLIANGWITKFNDDFLDVHTIGYRQEAVRAQRIIAGDTGFGFRLPPGQATSILTGTRLGESPPACQHVWASYLTSVFEPNIWLQGGTALAAGGEEEITDGQISTGLRDAIVVWADLMKAPWTPAGSDDVLQWGVFSQTRFKAQTQPFILMIDNVIVRTNVSASERRRRGTSRGGFQPGGN